MKEIEYELKCKKLLTADTLVKFVNKEKINKRNIQRISGTRDAFTLFYWKEIKDGN